MADAVQRIYAFDRYFTQPRGTVPSAGVTIGARRPATMWSVRAKTAPGVFGIALPAAPNTAVGNDDARALWLGPDEWLVVSSRSLAAPEAAADVTLTDVGHGRAALRLSGRKVRDMLAKGCALDLDPRVFPPNACAQTSIAKINVLLDRVGQDVFDLYCSRSYAGSMWHWLTESAAEFAYKLADN